MTPRFEEFMSAQRNMFSEFPELLENFPETAPLLRFFSEHLDDGQFEAFRAAAAVDVENRDENTRQTLENFFRLYENFRQTIRALKDSDPEKYKTFMAHLDHPDSDADKKAAEDIFHTIRP